MRLNRLLELRQKMKPGSLCAIENYDPFNPDNTTNSVGVFVKWVLPDWHIPAHEILEASGFDDFISDADIDPSLLYTVEIDSVIQDAEDHVALVLINGKKMQIEPEDIIFPVTGDT